MTTPLIQEVKDKLNSSDLSHIDNLKDLHAEIRKVKARLKVQELELSQRFKQLPSETLHAAVTAVVPFAVSRATTSRTWNLLGAAAGLLFRKSPKTSILKDTLQSSAKQVGFAALAKLALSAFNKKDKAREKK